MWPRKNIMNQECTQKRVCSGSVVLWVWTGVFGPSLSSIKDRKEVMFSSHAVIFDSGKVFYSSSSKKHMWVFLQGMKDSWDVCKYGSSAGKLDFGNLSLGWVWFLWFDYVDSKADSLSKGWSFKCGHLWGGFHNLSWWGSQELSRSWHRKARSLYWMV